MKKEITLFRSWEAELPAIRSGKWDEYPRWGSLYTAFADFLRQTEPGRWNEAVLLDLLYIIARDNEAEYLISVLAEMQPEGLYRLAEAAVLLGEPDARWQLAAYLGEAATDRARAEAILLVLVHDPEEYVSRRALLALAHMGSSQIPSLCARAWATGHEYQRIAVLYAIRAASPDELPKYLELAKADGRKHLLENAIKLEGGLLKSG